MKVGIIGAGTMGHPGEDGFVRGEGPVDRVQ